MKKSQIAGWVVFFALIAATALWHGSKLPLSIYEYLFLSRMAEQQPELRESLDLRTLMPGDWELACDASGYGGDFYLKDYDRKYPSVGDMQDSAWGLIFIHSSGKFSAAAGNCRSTGVLLNISGCVPRTRAVLIRRPGDSKCTEFGN
jgi:hypothetical protein